MEKFWPSRISNDKLCDEVDDHRDNLRAISQKVDPTHMSVVTNKQDILAMTRNKGHPRGTPNITMKKLKRCIRGDTITTRLRRLMLFTQLPCLTHKLSKRKPW